MRPKEGQPLEEKEKLALWLGRLEGVELIEPITGEDKKLLKAFAGREELSEEELMGELGKKLTPRGEEDLNEIAEEKGLDLTNPRGFSSALKTLSPPEIPQEIVSGEIVSPTTKLKKALEEGPSSLIDGEILRRLTPLKETVAAKLHPLLWASNPSALKKMVGAAAEEVMAQAKLRKAESEIAKSLVELAGEDAKRDVMLNYFENLERDLGRHLEPYCQARGLDIPPKGTPEREELLIEINTAFAGLHTLATEIGEQTKEVLREEIGIRKEIARNRMYARVQPERVEAAREANMGTEAWINETARTSMARVSGAAAGAIGGLYVGIGKTVEILVEKYPRQTVAGFLATGVLFGTQVYFHSGSLPLEAYGSYAFNSAVIGGSVVTLTSAVFSGLRLRLREGSVRERA